MKGEARMPLTSCPDCLKAVSDSAPACIHCGRPMHQSSSSAPQLLKSRPSETAGHSASLTPVSSSVALHCPKCASSEVRRLSLVFKEGLSSVHTRTAGVGLTAGGTLGLGGARTKGTHQ